ncbi:hypothetical protein [Halosimplex halobium]|uniref:hypothetical protein n=1 Tax=Halosimplex halobium TaxID=3396618 RepID=UPI003F54D52F
MEYKTAGRFLASLVVLSMIATSFTAGTAAADTTAAADAAVSGAEGATAEFGSILVGEACEKADSFQAELACQVLLGASTVTKYTTLASLVGGPYGWAASILIGL